MAALDMLKKRGVKNIHFMCIIAAPEGVKRLTEEHPDVDVYIGALDDHLNEHKYIVPGLGDAGDRIFGNEVIKCVIDHIEWRCIYGSFGKEKGLYLMDEYFMGIAMLSGMRSKDPNTQVGACIVDPETQDTLHGL